MLRNIIKCISPPFQNNTNTSTNVEHTPAKVLKSSNENPENIRDLNEILIVNDTPTIITPATVNNSKNITTIHNNNEVMSTMPTNQTAPIAREEDAEEEIEETFEEQSRKNEIKAKEFGEEYQQQPQQKYQEINEMMVRRGGSGGGGDSGSSKSSRVRNYLRKCKDRWLAVSLHNQIQEYNNTGHDPKSTMSTINELDVSQGLRPTIETTRTTKTSIPLTSTAVTVISNKRSSSRMGGASEYIDKSSPTNCALGNVQKIKDENYVDEDDDDDAVDESYEDIDFGLGAALSKSATATRTNLNCNRSTLPTSTYKNNVCNSGQIETRQEQKRLKSMAQQEEHDHDDDDDDEKHVEQLVDSSQMVRIRTNH